MMRLWGRKSKMEPGIPPHSKSVAGTKKLKDASDDIDTLKRQMSALELQAKEALARLHTVSEDYEQLQTAHRDLLLRAGEAFLICDTVLRRSYESAGEATVSLWAALEEQGLEHFHPHRGDPATDGMCKIEGDLATDELLPGLVARVLVPGLRLKSGGEILVPARVLQSVRPARVEEPEPDQDNPINTQSQD